MRVRPLLIVAVALLVALTAAACNKKDEGGAAAAGGGAGGGGGAPQGPPPVPVVVEPVLLKDYAPAIELVGEMRASQEATLAAEVSGRVTSIAHRVGESHPKGAALISIDPSTYSAALASANASLETARQQLALLEAGPRNQEVAAQEAVIAAARARYSRELDNLGRQQELYDEGVISEATLVGARTAADAAAADVEREEQRLSEISAGSRDEEIAAQRARVAQAASQVQSASLQLQRTTIAPAFDSVVSRLMVEVGQYVGPGTPLAVVVAAGQKGANIDIEAWFNLPQQYSGEVGEGDRVELRSDALPVGADGGPSVINGTVLFVAPTADPVTRQFPMRVKVTDPRLRPGMAVRARLLTEAPTGQVMIPADATVVSTLGQVAYRMLPPAAEGELPSVEAVPITTGEFVDNLVVIAESTLKPGDMIVTRGKEQLYPSAKIIPTNLMPPGGGAGGGAPGASATEGAEAAGADAGNQAGSDAAGTGTEAGAEGSTETESKGGSSETSP